MPRIKKPPAGQIQFAELQLGSTTAPCVPALAEAVKAWSDKGYKGATDTTKELLAWWFDTDHRLPDGRFFRYGYYQRDALLTLIYLWEVEGVRTRTQLLERYARELDLSLPRYDDFARYAVKMATGSGKTKVMSLAIAWQYLNAAREGGDYAKTALVIAPNVIVYERLRTDFEGGRIFRTDPVIPPSMRLFWDFECVMRGEGERASADGVLYLTNIQQLYERDEKESDEPEELLAVLGPPPSASLDGGRGLADRIAEREGTLLVVNDEAHHTHDEENEWNKVIRGLHEDRPVAAQLDFSATPRLASGRLFPWTVYDYPLKTAIFENVVKRPVKGVANIKEVASEHASIKYQGFLVAGVERWREYRDQLAPLARKPLLFIMLGDTGEADDVAEWLRTKYPGELGGERTLVIHTKRNGEITEKDLDLAREVARRVDDPDQPVNAIVSVLMLREGWDVQNVTVVVGLRPFTSKAKVLPEQAVGRGLRLMFRGQGTTYQERVDVIGNRAFLEFVEALEKIEGVELDKFEVGKDKLRITSVTPEASRAAYDIGLPQLSPALLRRRTLAEEIEALDVGSFWFTPLPIRPGSVEAESFRYEGYDILTLERTVEREYAIPEPQTSGEIIGYYARLIASDLKLPSQFAHLAPKVREFFRCKAFGREVDLEDREVLSAMGRPAVAFVVRREFGKALKELLVEEAQPELLAPEKPMSSCVPFPWSRTTYEAKKTVFNLVPCDNEFERTFARFLDESPDVEAFGKLPQPFGFAIEYTDANANLRYYYPDFVVRLPGGERWLIETKGMEGPEVAYKDRAARLWCENASRLTGSEWQYLKVLQTDFSKLQPGDFLDLLALAD